jgi:hypothetical protein
MDDALLRVVLERLTGKPLPAQAESFLLAALDGDQELDAQLNAPEAQPYPRRAASTAQQDPAGAYLRSVTVTGFPFLSHAELEAFFGRPSELYDLLASVLGLADLTDADKRLRAAQRMCEDTLAEIKKRLEALRAKLGPLADTDERARACLTALTGTNAAEWDIKAAEAVTAREVADRDRDWCPVAAEIAAWCDDAAQALAENDAVPALKQALEWLAEANADLRDERLAPLAALDLAQADDLAEVFDPVAEERQVIVLTHDNRLAAAIKDLSIPATILEVTRQPRPHVTVRECPN